MESALGLVELRNLDKMIKKRQKNARYLNSQLRIWNEDYMNNHAFMMFPILSQSRNELMLHLEKAGITTRTIMPLINQPYIKPNLTDYPYSNFVLKTGLLIGCHQDLNKEDLDYIIKQIQIYGSL